ncbi:uncharacterized protein VTP21DRAFT_7350 [Calcarisporiella thermophila]|uniref:uncharacterized protein n=1 Tax=Calcarisporiella thermophila TaxID=911321 RepID=UPI00374388CA
MRRFKDRIRNGGIARDRCRRQRSFLVDNNGRLMCLRPKLRLSFLLAMGRYPGRLRLIRSTDGAYVTTRKAPQHEKRGVRKQYGTVKDGGESQFESAQFHPDPV